MRFFLPALILASSAFVCAFALLFNYCRIDLLSLCELPNLRFANPARIALPEAVFKGSTTRVVADLMKKLDAMKAVDAHALIRAAAEKHRVPAALVKSIVAAESNFHWEVVSPKGAIGLMQLMPETAHEYGADPTIPEQNVDAGTRYLNFLMHKYSKYRHPLSRVIAAYNAGPGAVDRYHGIPPFRETRGYVARVMGYMRLYSKEPG
jgi:soluble lytic murein transglycosylase-like protein